MLRVGIIGSGTMAQIHAKNLSQIPDVEIKSIYDSCQETATHLADQYHAELLSMDDAVLNYKDVDIVVICTPTPFHAEYAMQALHKGKHVFLEKPLALSLEEGHKILRAASKARGKFMVGHVVRFSHEYMHIKKLLDKDCIGTIGVVRTARRARFPLGFDDWYADPEQSGGVIFDMLIHDIDYLCWCFGKVERVCAKNLIHRMQNHVDYGLVIMRFRNGIIAHLEGSWAYEGEFHTALEIAGNKGLINFNSLETMPLTVIMKQGTADRERVAVPKPPVNESPYFLEIQHFVECIRKDLPPATGAKEGYEALRIAFAALESAKTGQPVKL